MVKGNIHFQKLKREYIFPVIESKLSSLKLQYPSAKILNFGTGDIALPLSKTVGQSISLAVQEMQEEKTIKGYGPSEGYTFLREAIAKHEYDGLKISASDIFISDGINTDIGNFWEVFSSENIVGVPDPAYPVYLDSNLLAGRKKIHLLPCLEATGLLPIPPQEHLDIIYLCSPHNPTGMAMDRDFLKNWIDYARKEKAIILFDHAYAAFVRSPNVPRSIFEVEGAKEVAVEMKSFSKSAGFTGLRCSFTVIPKEIKAQVGKSLLSLQNMWQKRQSIKYNGLSYPIQKGALAVYSSEGKRETTEQVNYYLQQAKFFKNGLTKLGHTIYGGEDSPYLWWKVPSSLKNGSLSLKNPDLIQSPSWNFFDHLLHNCHLICIPGKGFGKYGEGFVRLSAFTTKEHVKEALNRIARL